MGEAAECGKPLCIPLLFCSATTAALKNEILEKQNEVRRLKVPDWSSGLKGQIERCD